MATLNLRDIKKNVKPKFNTLEALAKEVDESKMPMFTHKAKNVIVVAAKETGKSFPVELYKFNCMERDPMASGLTFMKFATGASKTGTKSMNSVYIELAAKYDFKYAYEPSQSKFIRLVDNKNKLNNQAIEYGSFENSDGIAGYTVSNNGYPFIIHIEEPVMQGDNSETPSPAKWDADVKTIEDTVYRHYYSYLDWYDELEDEGIVEEVGTFEERGYKIVGKQRVYPPIKPKTIITMNDWDPEHIVSKRTEVYHPREKFLDWCLGFEYTPLLKIWKDKIEGPDHVVPELYDWVKERWDRIRANVIENHTKWVYVERDKQGRYIDTLFGRMQKFANPMNRKREDKREETYDMMWNALITGDTLGLAQAFGMGYGGTLDEEKRFHFKSFRGIDTERKLAEEGRELLMFSMGWDHDANRGPVGTPFTLSGKRINVGNPFNPQYEWVDIVGMIHPQIEIEGYGKGVMGANTKFYHEMMIEHSKEMYDKYVGNKKVLLGTYAVFDDDDGSYVSRVAPDLLEHGYKWADALENKNGKIESGGFGVVSRDKLWEVSIDLKTLLVDERNEMLVDWLKQVPRVDTPSGEVKRSTDGKWKKRYKDISNSAEYAWWPARMQLMEINNL